MRTTNRSKRRGQRGTQIAEFALVLPILAFLAMAVSEGANFVRAHQVLNNAAREAARAASTAENMNGWNSGTTQNTVAVQAACTYLRTNSAAFAMWNASQDATCSDAAFTIAVTRSPANAPRVNGIAMSVTQATVTYRYPLQFLPSLPQVGLPNPLPLTGTAEFRNFY
jgi:Flp pilus assembly protein TadG